MADSSILVPQVQILKFKEYVDYVTNLQPGTPVQTPTQWINAAAIPLVGRAGVVVTAIEVNYTPYFPDFSNTYIMAVIKYTQEI